MTVTEWLQLQVFERSSFRNEAGAAISLTPNGARILEHWGFSPEKARGIENIQVSWFRADMKTVATFSTQRVPEPCIPTVRRACLHGHRS